QGALARTSLARGQREVEAWRQGTSGVRRARALPGIGCMAAVFPSWSNTALRIALVVSAVAAVGSILLLMAFVRSPWRRRQFDEIDQPVLFDHRHHTQDDGIHCLYCHTTASRAA